MLDDGFEEEGMQQLQQFFVNQTAMYVDSFGVIWFNHEVWVFFSLDFQDSFLSNL